MLKIPDDPQVCKCTMAWPPIIVTMFLKIKGRQWTINHLQSFNFSVIFSENQQARKM